MTEILARLVGRWIARQAKPVPQALAAVAGRRPATVITGGSRGIGLALTRRFAAAGQDVVMIARSQDVLEAEALTMRGIMGSRVLTLALDITRDDAADALESFLESQGGYLDVLVNNAAIGLGGAFDSHAPAAIDELIAINIGALTRLTRHALPAMKARGRGGILNIASLAGYVPGPQQAAYYASKAYVTSLTEAIAEECTGTGVRISVVAPGPVETGFHAAIGANHALYLKLMPTMSPEQVARAAYSGFMLGRTVVRPGLVVPLAAVAVRVLPHALTVPIVRRLLEQRKPGSRR